MKRRQTVMRSVAGARHAWDNHVKNVALAAGIPDSYRPVIRYLHRHPGSSQRNIAEFVGVTTSAINQVVKLMLEEDYLRKETDISDKRSTRLYLTEKSIAVAEYLHQRLDASDDAITALIGEETEAELIRYLDLLADFIRKELN